MELQYMIKKAYQFSRGKGGLSNQPFGTIEWPDRNSLNWSVPHNIYQAKKTVINMKNKTMKVLFKKHEVLNNFTVEITFLTRN